MIRNPKNSFEKVRVTRGIRFVCMVFWAVGLVLATESWAQDDRSAIDDYYAFKASLKEKYGLDVGLKESLIHQQRTGTSLGDTNYNFNGQFDFHGTWSIFDGRGDFIWLYMNIHQLGGITTTAFGERNGNITPINDSDPNSLLRFLMYRHQFKNGTITALIGKFEALLLFAGNRYAADDRVTFMAQPLTAPAAKDRTFSSLGGGLIVQATPWLSLGATVNSLDFSTGISGEPFGENGFYVVGNASITSTIGSLGEGQYRASLIHTQEQQVGKDTLPKSYGFIFSADQDLGDTWAAFIRIDNTDIQTLASPIVESYAGGLALRRPFNRARDRFMAGLFHTKSETLGDERESGFEVFYRFGMTHHIDLSFDVQGFWPARSSDIFTNAGIRLMIRL